MWFQTVNSQWTILTTNSETAQGPIGLWEPGYRTTKFTSLLNIYLFICILHAIILNTILQIVGVVT